MSTGLTPVYDDAPQDAEKNGQINRFVQLSGTNDAIEKVKDLLAREVGGSCQ